MDSINFDVSNNSKIYHLLLKSTLDKKSIRCVIKPNFKSPTILKAKNYEIIKQIQFDFLKDDILQKKIEFLSIFGDFKMAGIDF